VSAFSGAEAVNCSLTYSLKSAANLLIGGIEWKDKKYVVEGVFTEAEAEIPIYDLVVWEMNDGADCSGWSDGVISPPLSPC